MLGPVINVGVLLVFLFSVSPVSAYENQFFLKNYFVKVAPTIRATGMKIKKWGKATIAGEIKLITGNALTISKGERDYLVHVLTTTRSLCRFGTPAKITDFSIGDRVNIVGDYINKDKTEIVAMWIRDKSISKIK
ncbi:hypothetical protein A3C23_00240 [Candidatus Roizmanbacteria bacterium RIFCSPHIGHO2_02_FULL_37_13b]|uniref:DUF5666 domain-containing protein n=1 Tax=Candidatus Roizmanbacteria bacterium RIFCSPLOWO2_02_FULL_36_11 TaxID=1802071 RepID=A0A1F7JHP5_9BACT|nr:MAG: hypothetical protein A3C23_00240 [Candidatus Roizmanbacteria bacterium RIFCSPHIGHO2_02_FULL_37_13b]OGK55128.1 MAG: hypothetical protein A3H78_04050 [Candidatus Roizmanbacteria bacterium RIFCSPLOWO2_02_FULL_36_11]